MKYELQSCAYCSSCNESYLLLNEFGICADCFSQFDADAVKKMTGYAVETRIETRYYPTPSAAFVICCSGVLSAVAAMIVVYFFR